MTAYIIDDEPHAVELLTRFITATPGIRLTGTSLDAQEALEVLQGPEPPMLVFSDIDMPQLSGIGLAGSCQSQTRVVFTTSFREYGPEAFEKNAVDYLLKPFSYERFLEAVKKAERSLGNASPDSQVIFVRGGERDQLLRVRLHELLVIEAAENYIFLHTLKERLLVYCTLKAFAALLPADAFLQVHRSFIVRLAHIVAVGSGRITMENGFSVPLGEHYTAEFRRVIAAKTWPIAGKAH
jgi:DNA-binding LytR/AlgR family response regulator